MSGISLTYVNTRPTGAYWASIKEFISINSLLIIFSLAQCAIFGSSMEKAHIWPNNVVFKQKCLFWGGCGLVDYDKLHDEFIVT